jgi:hypothetical protein
MSYKSLYFCIVFANFYQISKSMSDLITLLDLSPNSYLLLTNRDQISQQFIFDVLIQDLVKKDNQLLLILLSNNWTNYSTIAAKCGLNLKNLRDKQLIKVIDIISEEQFDYQKFVFKLNEELSHLSSNSVLLIDVLSLFLIVLILKLFINCFINCESIVLRIIKFLWLTLIFLQKKMTKKFIDLWFLSLIKAIFGVKSTKRGFWPLISESLKIRKRRDNCYKQMNYKLNERSVKLLPLGSHLL